MRKGCSAGRVGRGRCGCSDSSCAPGGGACDLCWGFSRGCERFFSGRWCVISRRDVFFDSWRCTFSPCKCTCNDRKCTFSFRKFTCDNHKCTCNDHKCTCDNHKCTFSSCKCTCNDRKCTCSDQKCRYPDRKSPRTVFSC